MGLTEVWLSFHAHSSANTPGELYHLISPRLWSQQTSTILPVISSCLHHPLQQISHMNTFVHLLTNIPLISAHHPTRSLSFGFSCNSLLCVIRERWVYVERVQPLPPTGLSPVLLPHAPYWLWRAAALECKSAHGTGGYLPAVWRSRQDVIGDGELW